MRIIRRKLAAAAFLALLPFAAQAAAPEDDAGLRQNCVSDYFRFCSSYLPGSKAIRQCFGSNFDKLTPECRGAIQDFDRRNPKHS